jgi:hypothetical protein
VLTSPGANIGIGYATALYLVSTCVIDDPQEIS